MRNKPIPALVAKDIEAQVKKVLRGLGNPEPPLYLDDVRELLSIDRHYFSSADTGMFRQFVSDVRIAAKRVAQDPMRLFEVMRTWELRGLWLPESRQILIDEETPDAKHRWVEAHEIIHGITPWHANYLLGDDWETLRPSFHVELEGEANFGAGQLLFLQKKFRERALSRAASLDHVRELADEFENSMTSTLWRFVEEVHQGLPIVGIVSPHPGKKRSATAGAPRFHIIESPAFRKQFSGVSDTELLTAVKSYCWRARGGPLGEAEKVFTDANGDRHVFHMKSFSNSHDVLTLAVYLRPVGSALALP